MERVLVIGSGGSGKSTFAAALARKLALPLVHLDAGGGRRRPTSGASGSASWPPRRAG